MERRRIFIGLGVLLSLAVYAFIFHLPNMKEKSGTSKIEVTNYEGYGFDRLTIKDLKNLKSGTFMMADSEGNELDSVLHWDFQTGKSHWEKTIPDNYIEGIGKSTIGTGAYWKKGWNNSNFSGQFSGDYIVHHTDNGIFWRPKPKGSYSSWVNDSISNKYEKFKNLKEAIDIGH